MAARNIGLGKGLSALLGDDFMNQPTSTSTIPISQIGSSNGQPRKHFNEEKLQELAESIRQHGIIQPLTVRRLSSGYYQIIAGERRWRAARIAGLTDIPAMVIEADDRTAMELAMIENLQREDLNPMEEAEGYKVLMEQYGLTQEQAAQRVGKSRSNVANVMRLLGLAPGARALVEDGSLSAGHARAILPLSPEQQEEFAPQIVSAGLSVRQTEQMVKKIQAQSDPAPEKKDLETINYVAEAEKELSGRLGRACHIVQGRKKGRIEIDYYNMDDLNALLEALSRLGQP